MNLALAVKQEQGPVRVLEQGQGRGANNLVYKGSTNACPPQGRSSQSRKQKTRLV